MIVRERIARLKAPLVPSALRGLDPRHPLPITGAYRSVGEVCLLSSRGSDWVLADLRNHDTRASGCGGFRSTLNVPGTITDGTLSSAAEHVASHASPIARVTSVFSGQSRGSSSSDTRWR
jgi:hypothetical protein